MSKNLIAATAHDIYEQIQKVKTAKGQELEKEVTRMEAICQGGQTISDLAGIQLRQLHATGFLPDENILIDRDETKLVNAKGNLTNTKRYNLGLLDEFVKE